MTHSDLQSFSLPRGGQTVIFPSGIIVYNFAHGDEARLAEIFSSTPGMPVVFLSTKFCRDVFSQAEERNRTFVFSTECIDRNTVDPTYPAMWLDKDDTLPDVAGNVSVTAVEGGFRVDTLEPDPSLSVTFS